MKNHQYINQSKSNERYTPHKYLEAARAVMGNINLDPASCDAANTYVRASTYFTKEDDGLTCCQWYGNVWLNPPYGRSNGKSNQALWSQHLIEQYTCGNVQEAVLLVTNATEAKWFKPLWNYDICLTDHRIQFLDETGTALRQNTKGSAFVYFGKNNIAFKNMFSEFGRVIPGLHWLASHKNDGIKVI